MPEGKMKLKEATAISVGPTQDGFLEYVNLVGVQNIYNQEGIHADQLRADIDTFFNSSRVIDVADIFQRTPSISKEFAERLWTYEAANQAECPIGESPQVRLFDTRGLMQVKNDLDSQEILTHQKTVMLARLHETLDALSQQAFYFESFGRSINWLGAYAKVTGEGRARSGIFDPAVERGVQDINGMAGVMILRHSGDPTKPAYSLGRRRQELGSTNVDRLLFGTALYVPDVARYIRSGASFSICGDTSDSTETNSPMLDWKLNATTGHIDAEDYEMVRFLNIIASRWPRLMVWLMRNAPKNWNDQLHGLIGNDNDSVRTEHRLRYLAKLWVCYSLGQIEGSGFSREFEMEQQAA